MGDNRDRVRAREKGRGRDAHWPHHIPLAGWWDIGKRVGFAIGADRVSLVAAGATFYLILALFPALAAFVSLYGLVADPGTITDHLAFLRNLMPEAGFTLIAGQLNALAKANTDALSFGFVFGLLVALWSANNGIKTIFEALNIAYEEREARGFVWLNLLSLIFTLGAMLVAALLVVAVGVVPAILAFLRLGGPTAMLVGYLRWPVFVVAIAIAITVLYRFGPSRSTARWRWQAPGATVAAVVWLVASIGFSWYLQNFANYNATYGSLGAVIGFLMWVWISMVILLVGAELNAEMEHQTTVDSTIGEDAPMGARGAYMADTLGRSSNEQAPEPEKRR